MQERLLAYIQRHKMIAPGDRLGVAVSGGADSVALLRLLLEIRDQLGAVVSVIHFNHKLRGDESDADEQFVRELARTQGLAIVCESADTTAYAEERKCGIEAAARELRYAFFWKLMGDKNSLDSGGQERPASTRDDGGVVDRVATAHTMDDQAETVLLRVLRGAGTRGLSGIHPLLCGDRGSVIRPLLEFRRAQLRHYLKRASQEWREDSSNVEMAFTRNRLRRDVMPKLREFNPAIEQVLCETAEIMRAEEDFWTDQVAQAVAGPWPVNDSEAILKLPLALQRRVLRAIAGRHAVALEFHHVEQILGLLREPVTRREKRIELPNQHDLVLVERELRIERRCPTQQQDYEIPLSVPGQVEVSAAGLTIAARRLECRDGNLLDPGQVGSLRVRNWRPGDRYWPRFSSRPKKVKEMLQARQVPARVRASWPVVVGVVAGEEVVVWIPAFPSSEPYRVAAGSDGILLEQVTRA